MSEARDPQPAVNPPLPSRVPSPRRNGAGAFLGVLLGLSLTINFLCLGGFCLVAIFASRLAGGLGSSLGERPPLTERHHAGDKSATDKIACEFDVSRNGLWFALHGGVIED